MFADTTLMTPWIIIIIVIIFIVIVIIVIIIVTLSSLWSSYFFWYIATQNASTALRHFAWYEVTPNVFNADQTLWPAVRVYKLGGIRQPS